MSAVHEAEATRAPGPLECFVAGGVGGVGLVVTGHPLDTIKVSCNSPSEFLRLRMGMRFITFYLSAPTSCGPGSASGSAQASSGGGAFVPWHCRLCAQYIPE